MTLSRARQEWQRAEDCIGAAHICRSGGFYADAVSRAYYAVMRAAKAVLALYNIRPTSHSGVTNRFGLAIVSAGLAEGHWGAEITSLGWLRADADYDVSRVFSESEALNACARADAFLLRIRELLPTPVLSTGEEA